MHNKLSRGKLNLIITLIAILVIAVIVVTAVVISSSKNKKTPVSDEYITVTVESDSSASFKLTKNNFSVLEMNALNKTDAFLTENITPNLSFKQTLSMYLKNLIDAKKLGETDKDIVLFAVESRNEEDYNTLYKTFVETLNESGAKTRPYGIYIKATEKGIEELASENSVSYAKAYLCHKLEEQSTKSEEELVKLSLPEIFNSLIKEASEKAPEKTVEEIIDKANKEQREIVIEKDDEVSETSKEESKSSAVTSTTSATAGTSEKTPSADSETEKPTSTYSRNTVSYVVSEDTDSGWLPGLY